MPHLPNTSKKRSGFNPQTLSKRIRAQDDFFNHVHEDWLAKNPIPANEARWGTFMKLRFDTDKKVQDIITDLESKKSLVSGSPEQLIRDFYRSGMDMERRNTLDLTPLNELRSDIARISSLKTLTKTLARLHKLGTGALFGSGVNQDSKHIERYVLHLAQDGLGMPDRDYYLKDDAESVRVRTAYKIYVEKLFVLMGESKKEAAQKRDALFSIEYALATLSMSKEEMREPEKIYHKYSPARLAALAPHIDWSSYLSIIGARTAKDIIVMQPEFFKGVSALLASVSLDDWKTYLDWHIVNDFSSVLSDRFKKLSFSFYGTTMTGQKVMKPLWRRVLKLTEGNLGELIGRIYVERYFPKEAKKKMNLLVDDLFSAYEIRIKSLSWMSDVTKKKALQKLRSLSRKIGYPDKWRSYRGLVISPRDLVGNILRTNELEHRREMRKLAKKLDRTEWFMLPHEVNAYFQPTTNDIAFPAGILQPPFFDPLADAAFNYGAIGAVIGHEITHGFDDEGSQYDATGNLKSWWTPEDRKRFEAKAKRVEEQFNAYTVNDGLHVNGKLTCGENIADLGGLSIAYDAYQLELARTGRHDIDGTTPEERFFIGFALFECEHARPEFTKMIVLTNPHSPGIFRINGPVSNFEPFYNTYAVKEGDKLYRKPEEREMVW